MPLHLLFLLNFLIQFIETFVDGLRISCFGKFFFNNFAGSIINSGMHGGVLLQRGLYFLIFNLLGYLSHKIVLVLKELIQVTLLITIFD